MKISNKITLALGMAGCLGMVISTAGQADVEKNAAALDVALRQEAAGALDLVSQQELKLKEIPEPLFLEKQDGEGLTTAEKNAAITPPLEGQQVELPPELMRLAGETVELPPELRLDGKIVELPPLEPSADMKNDSVAQAKAADTAPAELPAAGESAAHEQTASDMPDYAISLFSHDVHVNGMGLGCTDCHDSVFQQAAGSAKAAGDFTMASFSEGKYCGACHDGATAFSVKEENSCAKCHGSDMKQPRTIVFEKPVKAVVFNHTMHTDKIGLACADCHEGLFKMKLGDSEQQSDFTMKAIYEGKYCGACHDGATAFAANTRCTKCHIGVKGYDRLFSTGKKESGHGGEH